MLDSEATACADLTAERQMAQREMRCWSEPKVIVIILVFFMAQPMNMGQRRSSMCQPSVRVLDWTSGAHVMLM